MNEITLNLQTSQFESETIKINNNFEHNVIPEFGIINVSGLSIKEKYELIENNYKSVISDMTDNELINYFHLNKRNLGNTTILALIGQELAKRQIFNNSTKL